MFHIDAELVDGLLSQLPDDPDTGRALWRPLRRAGARIGTAWEFARSGDIVPEHTHPLGAGHVTIVAAGTVRVHHADSYADYTAPALIDCPEGAPHSFEALTPGAVIINLQHKVLGG